MAGQGSDRREVIRILGIAAAASQFPGFCCWSYAQEHAHAGETVSPKPARYTPQFFSEAEYRLVSRLSELIIPSDETPGAKEAGVSEFIDFMVWSDPALHDRFRNGVAWMTQRRFLSLDEAGQQVLLKRLAYRDSHQRGEEVGQKFFSLFREYTLMGFYTTRIGLEQLDFPGLRAYSESPKCPHLGDPEHLRVGRV